MGLETLRGSRFPSRRLAQAKRYLSERAEISKEESGSSSESDKAQEPAWEAKAVKPEHLVGEVPPASCEETAQEAPAGRMMPRWKKKAMKPSDEAPQEPREVAPHKKGLCHGGGNI